jgi:2-oxoisovalerate dehydrogenase E1 component subunit alpha
MTTQARHHPAPPASLETPPSDADLLPSTTPVQLLDDRGGRVAPTAETERRGYTEPEPEQLVQAWRRMVVGRRFDIQATALTKQGRLAVYPSSRGQEACQVGALLALDAQDWFFPTYRDSVALITRDIDPVEVLTLLRGDAHCGYDPMAHHSAAQCTPLATQLVHAAGVAHGNARRGRDSVTLGFIGDGATSEGDFHEALNFAAVFNAPVIFFVQNNKYAISVPLSKQTRAPSLAHKGIGYGVPSEQVDGNDAMAVLSVMNRAVQRARAGGGPFLIEAHTYRLDAHTNADDATRYREAEEVSAWLGRDPIARLETYLLEQGLIDEDRVAEVKAEAERYAADLRDRMNADSELDPLSVFDHVYEKPTPQIGEQRAQVEAELAAEREQEEGH